jgi:adenine phosphoribosyltransferase
MRAGGAAVCSALHGETRHSVLQIWAATGRSGSLLRWFAGTEIATMDRGSRRLARVAVLEQFRWVEGHADVWRVFANPRALSLVVEALAWPWREAGVTKVCGIESRGFLLGGAVARELGAGFVAIRKSDGLLPGEKLLASAGADYRGEVHTLRAQSEPLGRTDRVLLVDDWAEAGSQAVAAKQMIESSGASYLGLSIIVDQLVEERRAELGRVAAIVRYAELP